MDCFAKPFDRDPSADGGGARELPKDSSVLSAGNRSSDMNPNRRSRSLERLSGVSIKPFPASGLGSTINLSYSSNDNEFSRPPRVPPRPNDEVLARFEQQKNDIVTRSTLQPGKVARSKYVNVDLREEGGGRRRESGEGTRRGREAEGGARKGREGARRGREAEGSSLKGKDGKATGQQTGRVREVSPKSRRQRTSGASLQPAKPVKRCKSSAGVSEVPRHQEYTPRRSAALPDSTPNPTETSGTLKLEPPSRPAIKPRKTRAISLEETLHSSQSSANTTGSPTLVLDSRTGGACRPLRISLPSISNDSSLQNGTMLLNVGDFNQEPQILCSSSDRNGPVVISDNVQPARPPPPNRNPPTRPPAPTPRPRKPRTPTTIIPDLSEDDQYVHMSRDPTTLNRDQNINPSLPLETDMGNGSDSDDGGAYSYVDLVKNRHLTVSPYFDRTNPLCTHDGKFHIESLLHVLIWGAW